jgi:hypothetical protein
MGLREHSHPPMALPISPSERLLVIVFHSGFAKGADWLRDRRQSIAVRRKKQSARRKPSGSAKE